MNERIKELARQATDFVSYIPCVIDAEESKTIYTTKFAELIVRECMSVCIDDIADPRDTVELKCAKKIKQHFGVKE